jgi:hypothetical protein
MTNSRLLFYTKLSSIDFLSEYLVRSERHFSTSISTKSSLPEKKRQKTLIYCMHLQKSYMKNATPNCLVLSLGWGFQTFGGWSVPDLSLAGSHFNVQGLLPPSIWFGRNIPSLPYTLFHPHPLLSLSTSVRVARSQKGQILNMEKGKFVNKYHKIFIISENILCIVEI